MYFADEPEHISLLRDSLRRFVATEMPGDEVRRWLRERHFPREQFARLAALGVCGLTVDEAYGGVGRDLVAATMVIEELCKRGTSLGGPYIHCAFYGGINISEKGSEAQKRELLPRLAAGEILFAYGLSEPDVGADLASVKCRAEKVDNGRSVRINGAKRWCTAAAISDFIYCLVRSDDQAPRYENLSLILVPSKADGVRIEDIDHVGLGYAETSDVIFEDVEVPIDHVIGGEAGWNRGWPMLAGPALDVEKLEIAAMAQGIAASALEDAWTYAQERKQFGRRIADFQSVAHALADGRARLAAAEALLYRAAWLADQNRPCTVETSMAKLFVTETAVSVALDCQKIMGAYGFAAEYDMSHRVQDLLLLPVIGGSSNIQRNNIAKRLRL
jgi:alkylation response protein AidB-like acyl-CoA dehydrogenase